MARLEIFFDLAFSMLVAYYFDSPNIVGDEYYFMLTVVWVVAIICVFVRMVFYIVSVLSSCICFCQFAIYFSEQDK